VKRIRVGCGAGYSGDRIEPAVELAERGDLQYLVFECLAERTIALAQQAKARDPQAGYDPLLLDRMTAVLPACARRGVRVITNMGAANPRAAAAAVRDLARSLGLNRLRIAAITGDDVVEVVKRGDFTVTETNTPSSRLAGSIISANAYLGAEAILPALAARADVIIAGRVADPSLFLAPLVHEFKWSMTDWQRLGCGTLAGHLLECAGQVTGGYFADGPSKPVAGLARLGFPIGDVAEDGSAIITKVAGSGGCVTTATCKEQLLYEIHDPAAYVTPDVVADFSQVEVRQVAEDRVLVRGATGRPRPDRLKVSIGYADGFIGEGQISYGGPGAVERARLAMAIVTERVRATKLECEELRCDLIGVDSLFGWVPAAGVSEPYEVRLRVAGRTRTLRDAQRLATEVETLYTNGPAGGGGVVKSTRDVLAVASVLIPRAAAPWQIETLVA